MSKPTFRFQTFKSGHLGEDEPEHLLPTGVKPEQEAEEIQSNKQDLEPLYPIGVNPE